MQTAKVFTSGNSQAVRLPKEFQFGEDEVVIKRGGGVVMLFPKRYQEKDLFTLLDEIGPLEIEREQQAEAQPRDLNLD